jgi:glutamyl-tRNA reductase
MGEQAAAALEKRRVAGVLFVNRSVGRARGLAERSGGRAMTLDAFLSDPPAVAAVLTATSSPSSLFGPAEARRLLEARRAAGASGPLVFADLAVPADVDPALRGCQEIDITGIDDLRSAAAERERAQRDGVARTRAILTARLRRLRDRESRRGEGLAFARAPARAEDAARRAAAELRAGLSELDSAAAARIERWAAEASHRMAHAAKRGGLDAALALAPAEEARLGGILTRAHGAAAAAWFPRAALAIARAAAGAAATGA